MNQHLGGAIWTNHALEQLKNRGIDQHMASKTFNNPDNTNKRREGALEFNKRFDNSTVTVIAKQNERKEWIIISSWIEPPLPGTKDFQKKQDYRSYQKASFVGKIFLTLKKQLGF